MTGTTADDLLSEVLPLLDLDERYASAHLLIQPGNGLPSNLAVNALSCGAVAAAGLSGLALQGGPQVVVDPRRVSVAFRSDRLTNINGQQVEPFAPLSGFFKASDGWVRTHANYPHHRRRLLEALGLPEDTAPEGLARAVEGMRAQDVEDQVTRADGVAFRVRTAQDWRSSAPGEAVDQEPLINRQVVAEAAPVEAPYRPKVLDLTRVVAGPIATQTLGFLGADVLRVDSPHLLEPHDHYTLVSGDKRSTLLDLKDRADRATFDGLLEQADVLVTGYRTGALDEYGLSPQEVSERHPHVVHAFLSSWGTEGPWSEYRGFDSVVQAATGISMLESADGELPGALPAQVLDHATGYLLAAGILSALRVRAFNGGVWRVSTALARSAHWLLDHGPDDEPAHLVTAPEDYEQVVRGEIGLIVTSRPALTIGERDSFSRFGGLWGADEPFWEDDPAAERA